LAVGGHVKRITVPASQQLQKFFFGEIRLFENPVFQQRRRHVFVVDRDRDVQVETRPMQKARVASPLVVHIETGALQSGDHLLGLRTGSFGGMPETAYGMVTATRSVVTSARSAGICSPVLRALSR